MVLPLFSGRWDQCDSGVQRSTGGDTDKQAFAVREGTCGRKGILSFDADDLIKYAGIEHFRHKARADPLNLVRTALAVDKTGDSSGSTATTLMLGFCSLR